MQSIYTPPQRLNGRLQKRIQLIRASAEKLAAMPITEWDRDYRVRAFILKTAIEYSGRPAKKKLRTMRRRWLHVIAALLIRGELQIVYIDSGFVDLALTDQQILIPEDAL
jgi:hypothetical protein